MADRAAFANLRCLGTRRVDLSGSFQPNGALAAVLNIKGRGFTVAHTPGGGLYTVTFEDRYFDFEGFWAKAASATLGVDAQVTVVPDVMTNRTMVITVFDTGTKAAINDVAFNANTWVSFGLRAKNTTAY